MKKNLWFKHDFGARNDPKLKRVILRKGGEAGWLFWVIIEMLNEEGGRLSRDYYEEIAYDAHCSVELVKYMVEDSGLFQFDKKQFWSERQKRDQEETEKIKEKNRLGGIKSGESRRLNRSLVPGEMKSTSSPLEPNKQTNQQTNKESNDASASLEAASGELFPGEEKTDGYDITPKEIFDLWNKTAKEHGGILPSMIQFGESRKRKVKTRMTEFARVPNMTVRGVYLSLLNKIYESRLLRGEKTGWKADFDWLFRDSNNWDKVLNGKYDDGTTNATADRYDRLHITATCPEDYEGDF